MSPTTPNHVHLQLARELLGRPASPSETADLVAALKQASDVFATPEVAAAEAAQQVRLYAFASTARLLYLCS